MASIRRNTPAAQRNGSTKSWIDNMDSSPSPKISRTYALPLRGLTIPFSSLDFLLLLGWFKSAWADISSHRPLRPLERPRVKWMSWKKVLFHLFASFTVGLLIGFTPPFSMDITQEFTSEKGTYLDKGVAVKHIEEILNLANNTVIAMEDKPHVEEIPLVDRPENEEIYHQDVVRVDASVGDSYNVQRKLLLIVTVTSVRPDQAYHLNRLADMLKTVPPPLLWIVVEWPRLTTVTARILRASGVMYRHHVCYRNLPSTRKVEVCQKNVALSEIKKHQYNGILHFANEDSVYSSDIFEEMRKIRRFGTWPVAFYSGPKNGLILEGPFCQGNKVVGWQANFKRGANRRFPVHYSAFAFNSTLLWDLQGWRQPTFDPIILRSHGKEGVPESKLISRLVEDERQMEGLADNCSRIMAWNVQLDAHRFVNYPEGWTLQSNLEPNLPLK